MLISSHAFHFDRLDVYIATIIDDKGSSRGSEMQKATTLCMVYILS